MIIQKIFAVFLFLFFISSADADPAIWIRLQGSNTVGAKLAPALAKKFLEQRGVAQVEIKALPTENEFLVSGFDAGQREVGISVAAHGTATGFQALASGNADVVMASRPIKSDENKALLDQFGDLQSDNAEHAVAIDGLAILVNPRNSQTTLSRDQIAALFSGAIRNWKELGGDNIPVVVYARDDRSGTWETFKELVLGKDRQLEGSAQRFESSDKLSDAVANNPGAIGFTGLASIHRAKAVSVWENNIAALLPTRSTVATEDYLFTRRLFLYVSPIKSSTIAREFIEYCQSGAGQKTVAEIGFVSQNIDEIEHKQFDNIPTIYRDIVDASNRLSVNFRFKGDSSLLDTKALRDIDRLANFLQMPQNAGRNVYLVGFSNVEKNEKRDYVLSRFRALAVRAALMKKGVDVFAVQGLGAQLPVASNGEVALIKNNRVEVWLGPVR